MFSFRTLLTSVSVICAFLIGGLAEACESIVVARQGEDWTPWYDPCGTKLTYTLKFEVLSDGSPSIMVLIDGAGVQDEYDSWNYAWGPGQEVRTHYFQDGIDHRAVVDFQPTIGERGFVDGKLRIEYFPDKPTGPPDE